MEPRVYLLRYRVAVIKNDREGMNKHSSSLQKLGDTITPPKKVVRAMRLVLVYN